MQIKCFHFNFIQVNTFVIFDESKEAIIVDPGNSNTEEDEQLSNFITEEGLQVKYIINTHPHIDHILGNGFCTRTFQAPLLAHEAGLFIYERAVSYAIAFNMQCNKSNFPTPNRFINEGDVINCGQQQWKILYTPGHADGSICLYNATENIIIVGDVLFENSIGRSDLPSGNFKLLMESIHTKILTLPAETTILPGHGTNTKIAIEKKHNPYIRRNE
ncbi:MAG: MBL fold metallo-hydrolase [Bacteroidales bacterium]|jgi:hydroxyacylglutathione hydrolase|nr:MBL fold metallo-hydrolase [Bacteroidales bacterium]MDD4394640.1 MBL fold metallo-hydrolase [Bacteroidales bacterium]